MLRLELLSAVSRSEWGDSGLGTWNGGGLGHCDRQGGKLRAVKESILVTKPVTAATGRWFGKCMGTERRIPPGLSRIWNYRIAPRSGPCGKPPTLGREPPKCTVEGPHVGMCLRGNGPAHSNVLRPSRQPIRWLVLDSQRPESPHIHHRVLVTVAKVEDGTGGTRLHTR